jgi:hypothetical protein
MDMNESDAGDKWTASWNARTEAMQQVLGTMDDLVGHATIPFEVGAELGGAADIVYFKMKIPGVIAVTSELIGRDDQIQNGLGNYELAICHRDEETWGPEIISRLAHYTLEAPLEPDETMDIGGAAPEGSTITAFLFQEFARFTVLGRKAGLLLCIGLTADELKACHEGRTTKVISALKERGVFPYTDLTRTSVFM